MHALALYGSDDVSWLEKPDAEVETTWVERKEWKDASGLARQISGFANGEPPGGLVVLGVTQAGDIVGVEDRSPDKLLAEFPGHLEGQAERDWKIRNVEARGHRLLFIYVPFSETRVLCLSDGTAYRRIGNNTVKLTADEIAELRDARGERSFEVTPVAPYAEGLLDPEIARRFLDGIVNKNGLTLPLTLSQALENKRLVVRSSQGPRLTVAGALALSNTPTDWIPGARLRFLRFEGVVEKFGTERNVIRDGWFDGPIPQIVERIRDFIATQVREFDRLGPAGKFVREPEYPQDAWIEAITNALVHRSYNLQSATVFVRMFDDRLEVESPGGFPKGNRPDPEGIIQLHLPRNRELAQALDYLGLVRLAREGTRRMHDEMKKMSLPVPEYRDDGGTKVIVTLRNDIARRRTGAGADFSPQWSEIERQLGDNYAIVRSRGLQVWRRLISQGTTPPVSLVRLALENLRRAEAEIGVQQKRELVDLLAQAPDEILRAPVTEFARLMVPYGADLGSPEVSAQMSLLFSRFDEVVEFVLQFVEQKALDLVEASLFLESGVENLLQVLYSRLHRDPFPPKEWLDRVVAISRRSRAPTANVLFQMITGRAAKGS